MKINKELEKIEANKAGLKRRLSVVLKNSADVDDIIQDAYVRLLELDDATTEICNLPAFLGRTGKNIAIDRMRWRQRTDRIFVSSAESDDLRDQWLNCSSPDTNPEDALIHKQMLRVVFDALSELPEKCSRAYVLSFVEDQSYKEISAEIGVSVSMIEKYMARARRHVQANVIPTLRMAG
jgi:RNA polymerase sigma factor (sigma-70 family)